MRILITGNAGFIGSLLTERLINEGHKVIGLDIKPKKPEASVYEHVTCDILDVDKVIKAARGVDLVINLAAKHSDFGISKEEFFRVNKSGTEVLLDAAEKLGIKKFIFFSSVAVYGNQNEPTNENSKPFPHNFYGQSKVAAENAINNWSNKDTSREVLIIRPTKIFGPESHGNIYRLINSIYNKKFVFVGNGKNIKSIAYVENLVDATIFLLERLKPGVEVYNYSDEPHMTTTQIVEIISNYLSIIPPKFKLPLKLAITGGNISGFLAKVTGCNFPITASRIKKFGTTSYHNSLKIRYEGFKQKKSLVEGIKITVEWYLKEVL